MSDLKIQASELGIKLDGRWSDEKIQAEIDKVLAAPKEDDKRVSVILVRNYRPVGSFRIEQDGELRDPDEYEVEKVFAGAIIEVSVSEARDIISKKIAARNDPLG